MSRSQSIAKRWLPVSDRMKERAGPIALTILFEVLLVLALLSLGSHYAGDNGAADKLVTTFDVAASEPPQPEQPPAPAQAAAAPAAPAAAAPSQPSALPNLAPVPPPIALPRPPTAPPMAPAAQEPPAPSQSRIRAVIRSDMASNRGPAGTGTPGDSQRIAGSGPNGEPLYAAKWYREPTDDEFRGYFSRVNQSGWALINCRTEPEFRVDHCVLVDEGPDRSGVGSAVLAMAWQFRVRPPRVGGRSMVGEWVRIRIDYRITRS